jgi:hypothetical protein
VTADSYVPDGEDRFSFGIRTVGWQSVDRFGGATRPPVPADRTVGYDLRFAIEAKPDEPRGDILACAESSFIGGAELVVDGGLSQI